MITSSYRWIRARRSSSVMSGRSTAMVSYRRRPGGHCGSSLSPRGAAAENAEGPPPSSSPPPSKKEPKKSSVSARIESVRREIRALGDGWKDRHAEIAKEERNPREGRGGRSLAGDGESARDEAKEAMGVEEAERTRERRESLNTEVFDGPNRSLKCWSGPNVDWVSLSWTGLWIQISVGSLRLDSSV